MVERIAKVQEKREVLACLLQAVILLALSCIYQIWRLSKSHTSGAFCGRFSKQAELAIGDRTQSPAPLPLQCGCGKGKRSNLLITRWIPWPAASRPHPHQSLNFPKSHANWDVVERSVLGGTTDTFTFITLVHFQEPKIEDQNITKGVPHYSYYLRHCNSFRSCTKSLCTKPKHVFLVINHRAIGCT